MRKLIILISIIIVLSVGFLVLMNQPRNYEAEYIVNGYNIIEKYDKNHEYYKYEIKIDDISFDFVSNAKYTKHRKLIKTIHEEKEDDILCVRPEAINDDFMMICYKNGEYVDKYIAGIETVSEDKKINKVANIDIYDKDHTYVIWNNKGYTSLEANEKLKFLSKESYDNMLAYQWEDYIITADYDGSRTFNKLYIYNNKSKDIDNIELGVDISFEAYFMGDYDGYIYLFDKKNKVQYQLDIKNKKIKVTSDKDGAVFYENGLTTKPLDNLVYNELKFEKDNKYNFILKEGKLYLRLYDLEELIRISDKEIDNVLYSTEKEVYYLVDEKLYSYNVDKGEKLLLVNFEWNFTYLNKIFVFD